MGPPKLVQIDLQLFYFTCLISERTMVARQFLLTHILWDSLPTSSYLKQTLFNNCEIVAMSKIFLKKTRGKKKWSLNVDHDFQFSLVLQKQFFFTHSIQMEKSIPLLYMVVVQF